jgi:hypothetical protein
MSNMENRTKIIGVRLSPEEYELVERVCSGSGVKPATYARSVLLRDLQTALPSDPLAQLKAREVQEEMGAAIAQMMIKAFREAEKESKRKK